MEANEKHKHPTKREFLRTCVRTGLLTLLGGFGLAMIRRARRACGRVGAACETCGERELCLPAPRSTLWQLDPQKCVQCGQCATHCVLTLSAVRCFHAHALCGYCKLCFGYFEPGAAALNTAAENQLCPTGAIRRGFVEDPFYEYTIDQGACVGCGKCVRGCNMFGNGSLYLQVRHDLCLNCNECAIARACPADAYRRVPAAQPYLPNGPGGTAA